MNPPSKLHLSMKVEQHGDSGWLWWCNVDNCGATGVTACQDAPGEHTYHVYWRASKLPWWRKWATSAHEKLPGYDEALRYIMEVGEERDRRWRLAKIAADGQPLEKAVLKAVT